MTSVANTVAMTTRALAVHTGTLQPLIIYRNDKGLGDEIKREKEVS